MGNCLCISSAVARRKAINDVGNFHGSLIQISDFDLWIRLAAIGNFHILDEKLTLMRIVSGKKVNISEPEKEVLSPQNADTVPFTPFPGFRAISRATDWVLPAPIKSIIKAAIAIRNHSEEIPPETHIIPKKVQPETRIISSNNLSAPSTSASNRSILEYTDVLGNFVKSPILDLVPQIFEDIMPDFENSKYILQAWLATYAWSTNSPPHHLFSDRVIASILENDIARKEVIDIFGAEIVKTFIHKRGQIKIRVEENELEQPETL